MKKILLITLISTFFFSCNSSDDIEPRKKLTGFILRVKAENKLSSGEIKLEDTRGNFLTIWKADGKDFDALKEPIEDSKYLYDFKTRSSFEYDYILTGGTMSEEIKAGRYYFHIQTGMDGRLNRTAGYVTIEQDNDLTTYEIEVPANGKSYSWFEWKLLQKD